MLSRGTATAALALGVVLVCVGTARAQQDHATPQEVMQRVQQAAKDIAKSGEAALATFSSKNPASVWKDSYIFVNECNEDGRNEFPQACVDAAGVDRATIHESVGNAAVKFFDAGLNVRRAK